MGRISVEEARRRRLYRAETVYPSQRRLDDPGPPGAHVGWVAPRRGNRYARGYPAPGVGTRIHRLTVTGSEFHRGGERHLPWRCDCGSTGSTRVDKLVRGRAVECRGCASARAGRKGGRPGRLARIIPDERLRKRWRAAWHNIRQRCVSGTDAANWSRYGGRGIGVRFIDIDAFLRHIVTLPGWDDWSLYLDRIDPDGDYRPGNLRMVDPATSARNVGVRHPRRRGDASVSGGNADRP